MSWLYWYLLDINTFPLSEEMFYRALAMAVRTGWTHAFWRSDLKLYTLLLPALLWIGSYDLLDLGHLWARFFDLLWSHDGWELKEGRQPGGTRPKRKSMVLHRFIQRCLLLLFLHLVIKSHVF